MITIAIPELIGDESTFVVADIHESDLPNERTSIMPGNWPFPHFGRPSNAGSRDRRSQK